MHDYKDAAIRHWNDSEHLRVESRLDNADHLVGFSAECALKNALVRSGTVIDEGSGLHVHIDVLWNRVGVHLRGRSNAPLASVLKSTNPFQDWKAGQRYLATGHVVSSALDSHRKIAIRLLGATGIAVQKGSA